MADSEEDHSAKSVPTKKARRAPNLNHRTYYFNRELSWLQFNERVLEEALSSANPLLERAPYSAIAATKHQVI